MIWQRVCLAIGLAVGGAVLSQGALAQTSDPANDASPSVPKSGPRPSSHLRKQAAVSALLLAQYTTKELSDLVTTGPVTEELIDRVARAMSERDAGKFHRNVGIGAVNKTKQLAFYRDDWFESAGLHADQFDASDVTELFDKCRAAIAAVGDSQTLRVGRAIYRVTPDGSR